MLIFDELEQAVFASMMANPIACAELELPQDHVSLELWAHFTQIKNLLSQGVDINPATYAEHAGLEFDVIKAYAEQALSRQPSTYLITLQERYTRTTIEWLALRLQDEGTTNAAKRELIINAWQETDFAKQKDTINAVNAGYDAIKFIEALKTGKIRPYHTGLQGLDEHLGGLYGGRLYIIAGRPAMGKTALALNIADYMAQQHHVYFVSLEMQPRELVMRLLATRAKGKLDMRALTSPDVKFTLEQYAWLANPKPALPEKLLISNSGGLNVYDIMSQCRAMHRKHGKMVLFIDYLTLIKMSDFIQNRVHQVEEITTCLKQLANELDIPVVVISQLSRNVENRSDTRPMLADLRDSGSIEQDADVVMFPYREEYYLKEPKQEQGQSDDKFAKSRQEYYEHLNRVAGKAEIIIAKNRQGTTGSIKCLFDGASQKFSDIK